MWRASRPRETQGEMVTTPRWVGQILEKSNLGSLESPDMVTELKQALSKEKMVGEYQISTLDPHFYIKLKETMSGLGKDDYDHVESVMLQLFRMRRGKLIKLADSMKINSDLNGKLTVEEAVFYTTIYETGIEFEKQIRGALE